MGISRHNALARYAQGEVAPAKKSKAAPAKAPAKKAKAAPAKKAAAK
jgi:hypothetical protein